jgi:hypothetical protein
MKQRRFAVALMTFVGGGLGGLLGACTGPWWLTIILTLAGALAMYLAYEWDKTVRAIKKAWKIFIVSDEMRYRYSIFGLGLLTCVWIGTMTYALTFLAGADHWSIVLLGFICFAIGLLAIIASLLCTLVAVGDKNSQLEDDLRCFKSLAFHTFPPVAIFYNVPRFTFRFAWHVFLLIHSEQRTICGLSVFVGALAGFILRIQMQGAYVPPIAAVLIGGICGLTFGLVSHELIAKRLLQPRGYLPIKA